jgi:hypothetical protein
LCGSPANSSGWFDLGTINTATFQGITTLGLANSIIFYSFGDNATNNWSPQFIFRVPPAAGFNPPSRGTRAVIMADMGVGSPQAFLDTGAGDMCAPCGCGLLMITQLF